MKRTMSTLGKIADFVSAETKALEAAGSPTKREDATNDGGARARAVEVWFTRDNHRDFRGYPWKVRVDELIGDGHLNCRVRRVMFSVPVVTTYDINKPPPQGTLKTGRCHARWLGLSEDGQRAERLICEPLEDA